MKRNYPAGIPLLPVKRGGLAQNTWAGDRNGGRKRWHT